MAKYDEISSTERLLDLIRNDKPSEYSVSIYGTQRSVGHRLKNLFSIPISIRKTVSIGVDLGHDDLKLIKIQRVSDQKFKLLDFARIPFDPDISRQNPQFHEFLKPVMAKFCGHSKNIEIWCNIPSAKVETRQIRIPKVHPKQIPNSVYWTFQRVSAFDDKEDLFDFEILGDVEEGDKPKIDVMAYTAPKSEIKELKNLFSKAGFPLTGISIIPFAFQNLLKSARIRAVEQQVSSLYIGRDWSRIDIFSGGSLVLSRGIKAGVKTILEALRIEIEDNLFALSMAKSPTKDAARIRVIRKKLRYELEQARELFFGPDIDTAPAAGNERQRLLKEDKLFKMIRPALERLVKQVERTLRHFSLQYENARVAKLFISSGANPHKRIIEYIGNELGIPTETLDPFAGNSNFNSLLPAPESPSERSSYIPAMGMALSKNTKTPNFLYTYKDKIRAANSQRINRYVFAGFLVLMVLCVGVSFWQDRSIKEKEFKITRLRRELEGIAVRVDRNLILQLVAENQSNLRGIRNISQKYLGVAVISEIADLTPVNVRLFSISTTLGNQPGEKKGEKNGTLILNGIVQGNRLTMESSLAGFLMELKNSPLFDQPIVSEKSFERYEDKEGLKFTARLKLV